MGHSHSLWEPPTPDVVCALQKKCDRRYSNPPRNGSQRYLIVVDMGLRSKYRPGQSLYILPISVSDIEASTEVSEAPRKATSGQYVYSDYA